MIGTYREAMDFLLKRTDFELLRADAFSHSDFKLERMRKLLDLLGNPERIPAVHVAGTKGKGSTASMIAAGLVRSGQKTGLFTSPHLERFEERIRIDGETIPSEAVVALCDRLHRCVIELRQASAPMSPTYFELTTALAWLWFQEQSVDVVVLEVGLGGRLDATNLCHPEVCAITSIGLDHTQQLGNTLGEIAFEKAGIIKPGIPVVSGVRNAEARAIIRQVAAQRQCPIWELDREILLAEKGSAAARVWDVETPLGCYRDFHLSLHGSHQGTNAALALAAIELFLSTRNAPDRDSIALSLSQISLPGRQEILSRIPLILLDSSHNVDSTSALAKTLAEEPFSQYRKIGIYGSSADKDIAGQFELLRDCIDQWIVTRVEDSPRSCPVETLLAIARAQMLECLCGEEHPELALKRAWEELDDTTCLVVTGSFFLSGKLRTLILEHIANENGQPVSNRLPESIY